MTVCVGCNGLLECYSVSTLYWVVLVGIFKGHFFDIIFKKVPVARIICKVVSVKSYTGCKSSGVLLLILSINTLVFPLSMVPLYLSIDKRDVLILLGQEDFVL